jgi:hypothetical protein
MTNPLRPPIPPHNCEGQHSKANCIHRCLAIDISQVARCLEAQPILAPIEEVCNTLWALHIASTLHPTLTISPQPPSQKPSLPNTCSSRCSGIRSRTQWLDVRAPSSGQQQQQCRHMCRGAFMLAAAAVQTHVSRCLHSSRPSSAATLPQLTHLLHARLLPLAKPSGRTFPMAIDKTCYRLAALCTLDDCPEAGQNLAPLQVASADACSALTFVKIKCMRSSSTTPLPLCMRSCRISMV